MWRVHRLSQPRSYDINIEAMLVIYFTQNGRIKTIALASLGTNERGNIHRPKFRAMGRALQVWAIWITMTSWHENTSLITGTMCSPPTKGQETWNFSSLLSSTLNKISSYWYFETQLRSCDVTAVKNDRRVYRIHYIWSPIILRQILAYLMMTSSNRNISALLAICAGRSPVPGEFPA